MNLKIKSWLRGSYIIIGVFCLGLLIRGVPELLSGPYPVGYDLLAGYAPAMSALPETYPLVLFGWQTSPLTIFILWFFWRISNIDLYLFLKVAGPVFYGLFVSSFYFLLSRGFNWSTKKSLIASALFLLQPAVLRSGWDQLRLMLGFVFLFLLLAETKLDTISGAVKKPFIVLFLSFLIVLSQQLTAVIFFVVVIWQLIKSSEKHILAKALLAILPSAVLFAVQIYWGYFFSSSFSPHFAPIQLPSGSGFFAFTNYFLSDPRFIGGDYFSVLAYVGNLSLYVVVPFLPLLFKGFFKDKVFFPMLGWLLFASYSILVFPWFALSFYWFWIFLLPIPLTVYAVQGLERLGLFNDVKKRQKMLAGVVLLGIVGFGYASSLISVGYPLAYSYMPPGLVKSCVAFDEIPDVQKAFDWTNMNLPINATVVVPESYQGFAVMILREDLRIRVSPALMSLDEVGNLVKFEDYWSVFQLNETESKANVSYTLLITFGQIGIFTHKNV